jgi:cytochrome c2
MIRRAAPMFLLLVALACQQREQPLKQAAAPEPTGDPQVTHGRELISQYGCNVCHVVPGVQGPQGQLGPSLAGVASRPTISNGAVQNTPDNVAKFIRNPAEMNPQSRMPPIGIPDADARAIGAYLQTLK